MPITPIITGIIGVLIVYFIIAQFRELPFYKSLRRLGYHCYLLQYSEDVLMDNEVGNELYTNRDMYIKDYVDMGHTEFTHHAPELIRLDLRYKRLTMADEILEPYFN